MPADLHAAIQEQAGIVDTQRLLNLIDLFAETDSRMKWAPNKKLHFEIGVIKAIQALGESSIDDVIAMISGAASAAQSLPASAVPSGESSSSMPESTAKAMTPVVEAASPTLSTIPEASPPAEAAVSTVPAPAEEPSGVEEPAPAPAIQAPSSPLSGLELWTMAQRMLIDERPLFETWLVAAKFLSHEGNQFTIGFSTEQRFFRESLSRYETEMAGKISELAGGPIELLIEVRDDLAPTEIQVEPDEPVEEAPPEPEPEPTPDPAATKPEAAAAEPEETEEDLKKDPLISEALDVFQARVIKS